MLFHTTQKNIQPPPPRLARASVKFPVCPGGGWGWVGWREGERFAGWTWRFFLGVCWGCFFCWAKNLLKVFEGLILLGFITKCWIVLVRCYVLKDFTDTQTQWLWEANMATHMKLLQIYHLVNVRNSRLKPHLFKPAQREPLENPQQSTSLGRQSQVGGTFLVLLYGAAFVAALANPLTKRRQEVRFGGCCRGWWLGDKVCSCSSYKSWEKFSSFWFCDGVIGKRGSVLTFWVSTGKLCVLVYDQLVVGFWLWFRSPFWLRFFQVKAEVDAMKKA